MIQRIQSIYLFLAAACSGLLILVFPTFTKGEKLIMASSDLVFLSLFLISSAISIFSLLKFKNRKLQIAMGRLNIIVNFILFAALLYTYFAAYKDEGGSVGLALFIPIVAVSLVSVANRRIMADEQLVRAADRLR